MTLDALLFVDIAGNGSMMIGRLLAQRSARKLSWTSSHGSLLTLIRQTEAEKMSPFI
jgi:hypothetical protein